MTAEIFDAGSSSLGIITYLAPTTGNLGDGVVTLIDFGLASGISKLVITLDNVGENQNVTGLGWGVDNLQFQAATTVPEPTSLLLLGTGLAGLAVLRKKKPVV